MKHTERKTDIEAMEMGKHPLEKAIRAFFLVVQWLRIHLSMQGMQAPSLVQEDPTGPKAMKPMGHDY